MEAVQSGDAGVASNAQQVGVPTYVSDLAPTILNLIEHGESGVFNVTSSGSCSRYDFVRVILECAGINVKVRKVSQSAFQRFASVPLNESSRNFRLTQLGYQPLPNWRDGLSRYLATMASDVERLRKVQM